MDGRLNDLKLGLANVANEIKGGRHDALMNSLKAAADTYATDKAKSAATALTAVMDYLHNEHMEAPFRYLVDVLDTHQRKGRRTKSLDAALEEARLAATVDALMDKVNGEGLALDQACRVVARKTHMEWTQLKNLRGNIRRGKARPEAVEVYKHHCRRDWGPSDEPPAPLATPQRKRKSPPKP